MSMEEKQNSLTFQDFSQSVLKPETREDISFIIQECYKKNIPIEINCLKSKVNTKKPKIIIANTTKGKGVSFMENKVIWHYRSPTEEDVIKAKGELL